MLSTDKQANRQTDKQVNKQTNQSYLKHNIFAKEVINLNRDISVYLILMHKTIVLRGRWKIKKLLMTKLPNGM